MQLPLDANQLGRLARRDVERACRQFLECCAGDLSHVLAVLRTDPPLEWPEDLLPFLSWVSAVVSTESTAAPGNDRLSRLFDIDTVVRSPMVHTQKTLVPGDEVSETLARRTGKSLQVLPGEGDRLVALDSMTLVIGTHLGYLRGDRPMLRAKRMTAEEQEAIQRAWGHLEALRRTVPACSAAAALFEHRFAQLLVSPNHDMPATLEWLRRLDTDNRQVVWLEVLRYQQRAAFLPGRAPSPISVRHRLQEQGIAAGTEHIARLARLADEWIHRLQPDPDVDRGLVQTCLEELEEYLSWEPRATVLPRHLSEEGVRFINDALERLAGGLGLAGGDDLQAELIEFRESYLKRLHARPVMDLASLDPATYIEAKLARNRGNVFPVMGDPQALVAAWDDLDAALRAHLRRGPGQPGVEPEPLPALPDLPEVVEADYANVQEFFDIDGDEFPSIDLLPGDEDARPVEGTAAERSSATDATAELERVARQLERLARRSDGDPGLVPHRGGPGGCGTPHAAAETPGDPLAHVPAESKEGEIRTRDARQALGEQVPDVSDWETPRERHDD